MQKLHFHYKITKQFQILLGLYSIFMIKSFSIQAHGIYQSRPYSKFAKKDSNNCKTPNSKHQKLQIQLETKNNVDKNPQKLLTSIKKIQKKCKNLSFDSRIKKQLSSPKSILKNNENVNKFKNQQSKFLSNKLEQFEGKQLRKTQNIQSKIQLQSTLKEQKICSQITIAKVKTPIKKFLHLIRQSKKDQNMIKKLEFHAQKLDFLLDLNKKQKDFKYLQIEDIILRG